MLRAQSTIEVYPGPGVDTYKSSRYTVEVFDGSSWRPSYVYQYSRKSVTYWRVGESPSVSFTTFGTTGPVDVRVTNLSGPITDLEAYPKSKTIRGGKISGSQATGTVNPGDKFWLVINGDDANPLFVFADAPKPCVPPGATYFGPGIREIAPGRRQPLQGHLERSDLPGRRRLGSREHRHSRHEQRSDHGAGHPLG